MDDTDSDEPTEETIDSLETERDALEEERDKLQSEKRFLHNEYRRLQREVKRLNQELEKLREPPLVVGHVQDVLEDGRLVVESTSGPNFVAHASDDLEADLEPGDRVALNQQSLAIVDALPATKDPSVYGAEVLARPDVSYQDVGGLDEVILEVRESVEYPLTRAELYEEVGVQPPKGVLMKGDPGTGKTLLAKAVAHHTDTTFIHIVGSELVRKYIGEGSRLVTEIFEMAREKSPSILFIDELDAIGSSRYEASTSGDREVQRTLMQLLAEMDGFEARGEVRIIAATNRFDMLDPALLRPGRFDRIIEVPRPDPTGREEIFKIHTRGMALADGVDLAAMAARAEDVTGADIEAICTEAGMTAIRDERTEIRQGDFEQAIQRVQDGEVLAHEKGPDAAFA